MWKERLCENSGDVMSVSAERSDLQDRIALQAERLDSFCTH